MQCPCGGETRHEVREVKKADVASQWAKRPVEGKGPWIIDRDVCKSCGRQEVSVHGEFFNWMTGAHVEPELMIAHIVLPTAEQ